MKTRERTDVEKLKGFVADPRYEVELRTITLSPTVLMFRIYHSEKTSIITDLEVAVEDL